MTIFLAPSCAHLRPALRRAGYRLGRYGFVRYADGEWTVRLRERVRGEAVVVANVTPAAESLLQLVALVYALAETGARVRLCVPHLAFGRLDRLTSRGESALGLAVARLISRLPVRRITALDVHSDAVREALGPRAEEVTALTHVAALLRNAKIGTVVAPDQGAVRRAQKLARLLPGRPSVAWIEKTRPRPGMARARRLIGAVRGKNVLIIDDMIDTGGTIRAAVRMLRAAGAREIRVAATHGIFSSGGRGSLARLPIREWIVSDSLPQRRVRRQRVVGIEAMIIS